MHKINGIGTVGIVGGGQLARMMIVAIKRLGLKVVVMDPHADSPCHTIADKQITAEFHSADAMNKFAEMCDVITYDFEHIDVDLLQMLEQHGHKVLPAVRNLRIIQDKYTQKQALAKAGIPIPKFDIMKTVKEVKEYPFMLKSRRGGYDGKGNYLVKTEADLIPALQTIQGDLMMEEIIQFTKEVSVIATRSQSGECIIYPIAENIHRNNILDTTIAPAKLAKDLDKKVIDTAKKVMDCFKGIGTFCVEMFVNETNGDVLVNEVAPRVHNSGHYTIEACRTSQFENHIRAILGLTLGSPDMLVPFAGIKNIIGNRGEKGDVVYTGIESALRIPNVTVHIYGKTLVTPGRKMGHAAATGTTFEEVKEKLDQVKITAVHYAHEL